MPRTDELIDAHARLAPRPGAAERLLGVMDANGIDRAVVSAGGVIDPDRLSVQLVLGGHVTGDADNTAVIDAAAASNGRLLPFWFGNPHAGPDGYCRAGGAVHGLELSPAVHGVDLDDPRTLELVATAASLGHPVYIVCLTRPGVGVCDLALLAGKFPQTTFVLGHAGATAMDLYGLDLVAPCSNVMAESSVAMTVAARAAVERLGAGRVLFGTEYPHSDPAVELTKLAALNLPPADEQRVLAGNARRMLGLPDPATSDPTTPEATR